MSRPGKRTALVAGIRFLWQESRWGLVAALVSQGLLGLLPIVAALAAGRAVTDLVHHRAPVGPMVLVAVTYAVGQTAQGLVFALGEAWGLRVAARFRRRVMQAVSEPPLMDHLLDQETQRQLEQVVAQEWPHPGVFGSSLAQLVGFQAAAIGSAVLVARWSVPVAVISIVGWALLAQWNRSTLAGIFTGNFERLARAMYFRQFIGERRAAGESRVFGFGPWFINSYHQEWLRQMRQLWRERQDSTRAIVGFLLGCLLLAGVGFGGLAYSAAHGHVPPATLAVTVSGLVGLTMLAIPMWFDEALAHGAAQVPVLFQIEELARKLHERTPAGAPVAGLPAREVRFEQVSFRYPGMDRLVLDQLDLTIHAGKSLGIVGVNGAGKTTLIKLLARLHEPTAGRITVDDRDLAELDPVGWQRRVAAIFQDFLRYELTARDNVALGAPHLEPTDERLTAAAEAAGALSLLAGLPQGWDTVLSRRYRGGIDLSGGGWQRFGLARALYAVAGGAAILVLDEPTANLDVRGEAELFDRFLDVTAGSTTVLISHRFSTVRRADEIVVIDGGRVAERGSHDQLMAAGGIYARLFTLQANRYLDVLADPAEEYVAP